MGWTIEEIGAPEAERILPLIAQVQALHADRHPETYRAEIDPEEVLAHLREILAREAFTGLIARAQDGSVAGYAIFEVETVAQSALKRAQTRGVLHQISVDDAWRRSGVGSALIEAMKERLRAAGVAWMQTYYAAFNEPSAALMRRAGFEPFNIRAVGRV